jgi:hypothetical protein
MTLGGIRRFTRYDATGLLEAQRRLAADTLVLERSPFWSRTFKPVRGRL